MDDDSEDRASAPTFAQKVEAAVVGIAESALGVPVVSVGRALMGPSATGRVDAADAQLAGQRAHQVPQLTARVDVIAASVEALAEQVASLYEREKTARLHLLGIELRRLVEDGAVSPDEIVDNTTLQQALIESIRRSIEAVSPHAVPFLVRLAAARRGPPDRAFRSLARAVSDMSESEIDALVRLTKLVGAYPPANAEERRPTLRVMRPALEDDGRKVRVLCGGRLTLEDLGPRDELAAMSATLLTHGAAGQATGLEPALDASIVSIGGEWVLALQAIGRKW